jgi:hypothetical protein
VNWFLGLDAVVRRVVVLVGLGLLLIVVGLTVGYCSERDATARAKFEGRVAETQAGLGAAAATTTAGQVQAEAENAAQTGRNREDILNAENATDSAGDAGDRGLRALCERMRYRDSERCAELRRANRADASR